MAALTLLQKHIRQRDLAAQLDNITTVLLAGYLSSSQVISLVHYIVKTGEASDAKAFVEELAQRAPAYEDELMTIAKQLEKLGENKGIQIGFDAGKQEGIREGIKEGVEKGIKENSMRIARTMLESGYDRNTVLKMTGLSEGDLAQIQH